MKNRVPVLLIFKVSSLLMIRQQIMKNKESVGNAVVGAKEEVMQIFAVKQSGSPSLFIGDPITNEFIKLDSEIKIDKDYKD